MSKAARNYAAAEAAYHTADQILSGPCPHQIEPTQQLRVRAAAELALGCAMDRFDDGDPSAYFALDQAISAWRQAVRVERGVVKSPCVGRCSTALGDPTCRGCHRTADEVDSWITLTDEQKLKILQRIGQMRGLR